tara:strand:+ start:343 stop:537 length:195 start_codon:yes stop_codon:yes gene_type:complete
MAIDSLAAVPNVAPGFDSSLLTLKLQLQNESATENLINDAVKQVQATGPSDDRQVPERLLDIIV